MTRCPNCGQKTISWSQKLFLKGPATCPACRGKYRLHDVGWVLLGGAVAAYFLVIALAREPALFYGALAIPVLAALLYVAAVPLAPPRQGGGLMFPCPHCGSKAITWKQKLSARPMRLAVCSNCDGNFTISSWLWCLYLPIFGIVMLQNHLPHPYLGPVLILVWAALISVIKVLWIPLVKK